MGSAAIDRAGNIGLGFSISSSDLRPAIGYTGHAASDAPDEMGQGEAIAASSAGSQASSLRWGDYSSMSVDPADECTFWYTNQYIPADGVYNWRTRIFSFQLPGCVTSPDYAVWPASGGSAIGRGRAAAIALDSAALLPSAGSKILSLSVGELPAGVTARIDPASVAPGQPATLTLTAAADAQTGRGQGYLIRATAGGATATAAGALDVVDADFAMKPRPYPGIRSRRREHPGPHRYPAALRNARDDHVLGLDSTAGLERQVRAVSDRRRREHRSRDLHRRWPGAGKYHGRRPR